VLPELPEPVEPELELEELDVLVPVVPPVEDVVEVDVEDVDVPVVVEVVVEDDELELVLELSFFLVQPVAALNTSNPTRYGAMRCMKTPRFTGLALGCGPVRHALQSGEWGSA
jgi:hypothetical protein